MSENIKDYGGIEGDSSNSAIETNVQAIHDASVAADDNTVYLPAGDWYIGSPDIATGMMLNPGDDYKQRGAAGLGFVGDGPEQTFLRVGHIDYGTGNQIRYDSESSHPGVEWRDLTYDGEYQNFDIDSDTTEWAINIKGDGDFTFENVRLRNFSGTGIQISANASIDINRCTFYNCGIGRANDTNGSSINHFITGHLHNGETITIRNSEFNLSPGNVIDFGDGSEGNATVRNCRIKGIGDGLAKIGDVESFTLENLYYKARTQELIDAQDDTNDKKFRGGWLVKRIYSGASGMPTPKIEMTDVEAHNMTRGVSQVRDGLDLDITGGKNGPLAFRTIARAEAEFDDAWQDFDGAGFNFDVGEMSVHDSDGLVYNLTDSTGSIDTLRRDNTDGFGDTAGLSVNTDNQGADPFQPNVPSASDVGINSDGDTSPGVAWTRPTDGDTITGTVTLQIDATDSEDADDALAVDYRVDGDTWQTAVYNTDTGYYEDSWDTSGLADGDHTLEARAADSVGNTSTAAISVTVADAIYEEWTPRWGSSHDDWSVVTGSDFEGGDALAFENDSADRTRYGLSCDRVGEPADVEVLDKFRVPSFTADENLGFHARASLRSSVENGNENGYWLEVEAPENCFRLAKYTDGNLTTLKRFGTPVENTFFYRRFRVEGNTVKAKVWQATESEPANWDVEVTDSDHTDGWVGLGSFDAERVETDIFSVATNGDTAPFVNKDSSPGVAWTRPTDGDTITGTVTLQIDATDSEDADDALAVDYRVDGDTWQTAVYNTDTGYYEDSWDTSGLADGDHTLEARAADSGGNTSTAQITVSTDNSGTAPAIDSLSLSEVETSNSDAEFDADWTVSDSDGNLDSVELVLTQDSDGSTEDTATVSVTGDTANGTTRLSAAGDDGTNNSYTVDLTVSDTKGNTRSDVASTTETEDTGSAPTIDRMSVSEAGRPDPHAEVTVVWDVSDADGDLANVDITVTDSNGTSQSVTWSVNGGKTSDTDSFKVKDADGKTFDVILQVTDSEGQSTSQTKSVTA